MTNTLITSTIRPGLILILRTGVVGNVQYSKTILKAETETEDGKGSEAKWETERLVKNAEEQKEATQVRSKIRSMISAICAQTSFGQPRKLPTTRI